jgi:glycosyltransferase involved in cell wall biosynthesis
MKIAMVSEHASPLAVPGEVDAGGQNVHVASLAGALGDLGADVEVYTRRDARDLPCRVRTGPRVEVVHVDAGPARRLPKDELLPYMGRFERALVKAWGTRPPDVAHAHFWMSGLATHGAATRLGIPNALTFHALGTVKRRQQGRKDTSPPERLDIERRLARGMDRVLATSNEEVFEVVRMGAHPAKVCVVPCGVDTARFTPEGERDARGDRPRVVVVSRLVERKGIGNVITAIAATPGVELVVVGGPPAARLYSDSEAGRLQRLAAQLGIADRVRFVGGVEPRAVARILRSADVVVCAPWYEPFGMVAVEAMACGVPVVATAVGGLVDTVIDGVTGIHIPPRDPAALVDALVWLLADPARRAKMGAAGAHRAHTRYAWHHVARETLRIYQTLASDAVPQGSRRATADVR